MISRRFAVEIQGQQVGAGRTEHDPRDEEEDRRADEPSFEPRGEEPVDDEHAHEDGGAGHLGSPLIGHASSRLAVPSAPRLYWRAIAIRNRSSEVIRWSRSSAASSMSIWTQRILPVNVLSFVP
jgi:hypothetical protein